MKLKYLNIFFMVLLINLACVSVKESIEQQDTEPVRQKLSSGWYECDFERTLKSVEREYNFKASTGMDMVFEVSYKFIGVVCRVEDGALYDPVSELELLIDTEGNISCAENISIKGKMGNNGSFSWSGLVEEHKELNSIFVKGQLTHLPASAIGGPEFNGIYHLRNVVTGREQLANISNGFYTQSFLDGEDAGVTSWPVLVRTDGAFNYSVEITAVAEVGNLTKTNTSSKFTSLGKVIPGKGITLEVLVRTSAQAADQNSVPQIYAGTNISAGEFPNEKIPADIENLIRAGRAAVQSRPKPNPEKYPSWYRNLPSKPGFIYAAGEKTFAVKETALAMAEAAAAAILLEQLSVKIESEITASENKSGTLFDERIKSEAFQRLNYRIVERVYNEETNTGFVLVEMSTN